MSIEVMSAVMNRYPAGAGERLVALALADNASSDGQRIFPSIEAIAHRSFLSRRAVQRHISTMVASGWLVLVRATSGRPGDTNHFRISAEWLAGGQPVPPQAPVRREPRARTRPALPLPAPDLATPPTPTGANLAPVLHADYVDKHVHKAVDNPQTEAPRQVTKQVETGDASVTLPVKNHQDTNTPPTPHPVAACPQNSQAQSPLTDIAQKIPQIRQRDDCPTETPAQHPTAEPPTAGLSGEQPTPEPPAAGQPTAAHPQSMAKVPACAKGKRWRSTRSGVERVGVALGLGAWDEGAYHAALMRGAGVAPASFAAYEAAVLAELARRGVAQRVAHGGVSAEVLPPAAAGFVAAAPLAVECRA